MAIRRHKTKRSRGFTLLEMAVVTALVAVLVSAVVVYAPHRDGTSTAAAMAAIDGSMAQSLGIARANATGATMVIEPNPTDANTFRIRIFKGTPQNIGDTLQLVATNIVPMGLTGGNPTLGKGAHAPIISAFNLYSGKWIVDLTGNIDVFVASDGQASFAADWDPTTPAGQVYPGCSPGDFISLAMAPRNATDPTPGQYGSMRLSCNASHFVQYDVNGYPYVSHTPAPSAT